MPSRRDFIKFAVVGSVAAGCPIDQTLLAAQESKSAGAPVVHGEGFQVCHQIRDGHSFERPGATRKVDIVIVGGGVAGLAAAVAGRRRMGRTRLEWQTRRKAVSREGAPAGFRLTLAFTWENQRGLYMTAHLCGES